MTATNPSTKPTRRAKRGRDRGVAMLIVLTWLSLMIALVSEFTYGTSVESAQAANARDELKAHYLARSSVNLSRLLIKIQQDFIDPIMSTAQKMISGCITATVLMYQPENAAKRYKRALELGREADRS